MEPTLKQSIYMLAHTHTARGLVSLSVKSDAHLAAVGVQRYKVRLLSAQLSIQFT